MKFKIDENLPIDAALMLERHGRHFFEQLLYASHIMIPGISNSFFRCALLSGVILLFAIIKTSK